MSSAAILRDFLRQNPMLKPAIWFSSGLLLACVVVIPDSLRCWGEIMIPVSLILSGIFLIVRWPGSWIERRSFLLSPLPMLAFMGLGLSNGEIQKAPEEGLFMASVSDCQQSGYGQRCQIKLRQKLNPDGSSRHAGAILLNLKSDSALLKPGHQVLIGLRIRAPHPAQHRSDFNERQWLLGMGLTGQAGASEKQFIVLSHRQTAGGICAALQARAVHAMAGSLQSDVAKEILPALVLGDRGFLRAETRGTFRNIGIFHILAVSGMHVGLVFLMLHRTLSILFDKKPAAILFALLGVWLYALCTGGSPSAMRAALLCTLYGTGLQLERQNAAWNALGCCFLLLLCFQPFLLHNIGFQLSFAAITGILALFRPVRALAAPQGNISAFLWDITALSIAAQAGSAPVSLLYFHDWPGAFLLGNLIAVPMAPVLLGAGSLLCLLGVLGLPSEWLGRTLDLLISKWSGLIEKVELLSGPPAFAPAPAWSSVGLLTILILFALHRHSQERFPPVHRAGRNNILLPLFAFILIGWALQHHFRVLGRDRIALTWNYSSGYSCYGTLAGVPFQYSQKQSPIPAWLNWQASKKALDAADSCASLNRPWSSVLHIPGLLIIQGRPPSAAESIQSVQILGKNSVLPDNQEMRADYLLISPDLSRYQRAYLKKHCPPERRLAVSRGQRIVFTRSCPGARWQLER